MASARRGVTPTSLCDHSYAADTSNVVVPLCLSSFAIVNVALYGFAPVGVHVTSRKGLGRDDESSRMTGKTEVGDHLAQYQVVYFWERLASYPKKS